MTFLVIDRYARDLLRRELATAIVCLGDLEDQAQRAYEAPGESFAWLRRQVQVVLHLLDDLGWEWYGDPREVYYLTAPPADIRWWVQGRLDDESLDELAAEIRLQRHRGSDLLLEEAREDLDLELDLQAVLRTLLERLDQEGGDA